MSDELSGTATGAASGASAGAMLGPWGALAGGVIGGALGFFGAQAKSARIRAQTEEQLRRTKLQQEQQLGYAQAAGAASGVEYDSPSLQLHLASMSAEFQRQRDWLAKTGAQQAGDISSAGTAGLVGDLGGTLFSFGKANNWWRKQ